MNNVSNIYKITTNIKDKSGSNLSFMVVADNIRNAIYVTIDCKYNGQLITSENIISVQLAMKRVVSSYYDALANDLNPNYIDSSTDNIKEDK